jgi:hypothetical protein
MIYVSSYYYIRVLMLLGTSARRYTTLRHVSSYYFIRVLIPLGTCRRTYTCVLMLLRMPHTLCLMPYALCLMPCALPVHTCPHAAAYAFVCLMPYALCRLTLQPLCLMSYALCLMPRYVSEEVHDSLYNPYDFDLMEFVAKNIAARRARGSFSKL